MKKRTSKNRTVIKAKKVKVIANTTKRKAVRKKRTNPATQGQLEKVQDDIQFAKDGIKTWQKELAGLKRRKEQDKYIREARDYIKSFQEDLDRLLISERFLKIGLNQQKLRAKKANPRKRKSRTKNSQGIRQIVLEHIRAGRGWPQIRRLMVSADFSPAQIREAERYFKAEHKIAAPKKQSVARDVGFASKAAMVALLKRQPEYEVSSGSKAVRLAESHPREFHVEKYGSGKAIISLRNPTARKNSGSPKERVAAVKAQPGRLLDYIREGWSERELIAYLRQYREIFDSSDAKKLIRYIARVNRLKVPNPTYTLEAKPDARVRAMTQEFKVPTKTLANLAMRGYVQEQGGGNPNAYTYKLTKLGLARWRVEAKPKIKAARSTIKAFTAGSATRKFKRSLSGPKSAYQISVERNPKRGRTRNPDFYASAVELLRKLSGGTAFTRLTVAEVTKALERKGYSRDRIRKGLIDLARADEIGLFREDDNLAITPEDEKFAFVVGGQPVHRIRVIQSIGQSRASQGKKREAPVGWTQGSEGFQKASRKKTAKPKRPLTKVEAEYAKLLKEAGIDYEPNPKRHRNSTTSDFALAGRISRAIAALERKPETATRKAQIKKLQSYLAKVYQRAEAQRQAEAAAIYAAPRSFASSRKGGSVRKKKNPTLQEMLRGGGIRRVFAEAVMDFGRANHPDPAMVASLIDLGLKAGMTPPAIKRLLARKKGTKTAIRLVNARMLQLQRRGDLDSYRAASKNPRRRQKKAAGKKQNPTPAEIRKEFAGRYKTDSDLLFPEGTPKGLAKLGKLLLIKCESGPVRPVKGTVWLCSDTKGKLHIGTTKADATSLFPGPKASLGEISRIEYDESKPHLGYVNRTIFFHKMGEENGVRPRLVADGRGGLLIKGGDYRIRREGIIN